MSAAARTFSAKPLLPLNEDTLAHAGALAGRQRLTGAFLIETARIRPDPTQPRRSLDTQAQVELSASIERLGILQPITVRYDQGEDVYLVITGERRYRAAKALDLPAIPCWVKTPKSEEVLIHQIVENWQRSDLAPLELAKALVLLKDVHQCTQKDLARMLGKPESEVSRHLKMLELAPEVRKQAEEDTTGSLSRRHLTALADLPSGEQPAVAQKVVEEHLTAAETERFVREAKAKRTGLKTRGAPLTQRVRYTTSHAIVSFTFRRRDVAAADIVAALDEVREQVLADKKEADAHP